MHSNIVVYFFSIVCHVTGCTAAALIGAAANGHLDVMNFLILNVPSLGQHIQVACDAACKMGKMNIIKYFVSTWSCGCSPTGLDDLAMFGDTSIIEYLLKNDILPPLSYLMLASDLSDEDTISLQDEDELIQKVFDGEKYIEVKGLTGELEFGGSECMSVTTDDMADWDEDFDDDADSTASIGQVDKDEGIIGIDDGKSIADDDDDYDIDEEEDSFDRYHQKKKETKLTSLFDDPQRDSSRGLDTIACLPQSVREASEIPSPIQDKLVVERGSLGANSIELNNLDTFQLRSLAGEMRCNETYRQWSPVTWRENIENTMDRVVCNDDRMTIIPFLHEKFCARNTSTGIEKACEAGCLDILQWIHETHCSGNSSNQDSSLFSPGSMNAACIGGQGEVAMWLVNTVKLSPPSPEIAMAAAEKGSVSFLKWLHITCGIELHPDACNLAASSGNCEVLKWLYDYCKGTDLFKVDTVDLAAINGHYDVMVFLESIGIKSSAIAADGALMNGHLDVYNHLAKLGAYPSRYTVRYASLPWPSYGPRLDPLIPCPVRYKSSSTSEEDLTEEDEIK